jgi:hypothetical protein
MSAGNHEPLSNEQLNEKRAVLLAQKMAQYAKYQPQALDVPAQPATVTLVKPNQEPKVLVNQDVLLRVIEQKASGTTVYFLVCPMGQYDGKEAEFIEAKNLKTQGSVTPLVGTLVSKHAFKLRQAIQSATGGPANGAAAPAAPRLTGRQQDEKWFGELEKLVDPADKDQQKVRAVVEKNGGAYLANMLTLAGEKLDMFTDARGVGGMKDALGIDRETRVSSKEEIGRALYPVQALFMALGTIRYERQVELYKASAKKYEGFTLPANGAKSKKGKKS